MLHEKYCGAIIHRIYNGEMQFLIIKHSNGGHWSFPKGHVENNESEEQTAIREIFEETGLNAELDTGFRKIISYSPYKGCVKDVVFFSATADDTVPVAQISEVDKIVWLNKLDAFNRISYTSYKNLLISCIKYLNCK